MSLGLSVRQKALKINLLPDIYGTFAEIGAGQDVAGHFFKAGGASGTIAKSISAYDMTVSDLIYGKSGRYVSQSRLERMLEREFDQVVDRLKAEREKCRFFAFANTVAARNYQLSNESHGWIGLRFMHECDSDHSEVLMHVRMLDTHNIHQQDALGDIGVNLIHACYFERNSSEEFYNSLFDNLDQRRLELNMIKFQGPAFEHIDNRIANLQLVTRGLTKAVLFDEKGKVELPSDALYKKNIMVVRGSYRPPTLVNIDIMASGLKNFSKDIGVSEKDVESVAEITINQLTEDQELSYDDFLARLDLLAALKQKVLISNYPQFFRLSSYFREFTKGTIAIVLGAYNFEQIFNKEYRQVSGGVLEALGRLFQENVSVYVYPYLDDEKKDIVSTHNLNIPKKYQHLLDHIAHNNSLKAIEDYNSKNLHIYSRKVLDMIHNKEDGWQKLVPKKIAEIISKECLFQDECYFGKNK